MNIENIQKLLLDCYSKELCYPKILNNWNKKINVLVCVQ